MANADYFFVVWTLGRIISGRSVGKIIIIIIIIIITTIIVIIRIILLLIATTIIIIIIKVIIIMILIIIIKTITLNFRIGTSKNMNIHHQGKKASAMKATTPSLYSVIQ